MLNLQRQISVIYGHGNDLSWLLAQLSSAKTEFYEHNFRKPGLILTTCDVKRSIDVLLGKSDQLQQRLYRPQGSWHRALMFEDMPIVGVHRATSPGEMVLVFWHDLELVERAAVLASMYPRWANLSPMEMHNAASRPFLSDVGDYLEGLVA